MSLFTWFLSYMKVAASVFLLDLYICYLLSSNNLHFNIKNEHKCGHFHLRRKPSKILLNC